MVAAGGKNRSSRGLIYHLSVHTDHPGSRLSLKCRDYLLCPHHFGFARSESLVDDLDMLGVNYCFCAKFFLRRSNDGTAILSAAICAAFCSSSVSCSSS